VIPPAFLKVCVIGFGSIGKRHCQNLKRIGVHDITLFRETGKGNDFGFQEIYNEDELFSSEFDFFILSNPTALHYKFLEKLIPKQSNILVEKPIVATWEEFNQLELLLKNYSGIGMCAYNLRFHPCIQKAKEILEDRTLGKTYSARFFVGQYLPDWRPNTDYRTSYSSSNVLGGGVVLDLIHEIDLANYLCGFVKKNFHSIVGKLSDLEIETEDLAEIHYQSSKDVFVSIHMDYLVQGYSRYFEIICEKGRLICDLFKNEIQIIKAKNEVTNKFTFGDFDRNDMYLSLMEYYIKRYLEKISPTPSLIDGLDSLKTALRAKTNSNKYE
jgi:predicted dehydrogenase